MKIYIVAAYYQEVEFLIKRFKAEQVYKKGHLKHYSSGPYQIIISASGAQRMSEAFTYLRTCDLGESDALINVGIAGHTDLKIGTLVQVTCVTECFSTQSIKLHKLLQDIFETQYICQSVDLPENQYVQECIYDMEAWSFVFCANALFSLKNTLVIKMISDNKSEKIEDFSMLYEHFNHSYAPFEALFNHLLQ